MKRIISLILVVVMVTTLCPFSLFAETVNATIRDGKAYDGDPTDPSLLMNQGLSPDQITDYLVNTLGEQPDTANNKYTINPYVFEKYRVVAYTSEDAITPSCKTDGIGLYSSGGTKTDTETGQVERRYLGYKVNGTTKIPNDFFPADSKTVSLATSRNYVVNDSQLDSWGEYQHSTFEKLQIYLLKKKLWNDDDSDDDLYSEKGYTVEDLIKTGDMTTLMQYAKLMQAPNFGVPGQMELRHYSGGKYWYDTVRRPEFTFDMAMTVEPKQTLYRIYPGTESVDIDYTTRVEIKDLQTDGKKDGSYFRHIVINNEKAEQVFTNRDLENRDLPELKQTSTRTEDTSNMAVGDKRTVSLNPSAAATTGNGTFKGVSLDESLKITIEMIDTDLADFEILRNATNITDSTLELANLNFSPAVKLTLNDTSAITNGTVTKRKWSVYNGVTWEVFDSNNEASVDYTINAANKHYLQDNKIKFKLELETTDEESNGLSAEHGAGFSEKTSGPGGSGVVAVITSDADFDEDEDYYEAMEGEVVTHKGNKSYHLNGLDIDKYTFDIGEAFGEAVLVKDKGNRVDVFYPDSDGGSVYRAYLEVEDELGATDTDSLRIKIHPAEFNPEIKVSGTLKENRKVHLKMKNHKTLRYYPIDWSSVQWTIEPLDGQGDVVRVDGSLSGTEEFDLLFKAPGRYKVTVGGYIASNYNTKRYYGETSEVLTIIADQDPVADFLCVEKVLRDVENNNLTKLDLLDTSTSPDGDYLVQRIWSYKFDSDNDGDFEDETSTVISAGNNKNESIYTSDVGRYKFELKVKENFGQPTLTQFITDLDNKRDDTASKPEAEKVTEIINVAPTIDITMKQKKNVNVIVYNDYTTEEQLELNSKLTSLKARLLEKKINLKIHYLTPIQIVGNKIVQTNYFDTYVKVDIHTIGEIDHDGPWISHKEYDVDEIKSFYFYLDSFCVTGNDVTDRINQGRFEVIDLDYNGSNYIKLGSSRDYEEFAWKVLKLEYKDNGVTKTQNYNFVYDWRDYRKDSDGDKWDDGLEYTSYEIVGYELVEDEYRPDRLGYVEPDHTFQLGDDERYTRRSMPNNSSKSVSLKSFNTNSLDTIIEDIGEEDAFFINLTSEENRLALNRDFLESLESNNINYLTLEDDLVAVNPLTGRFNEYFLNYQLSYPYSKRPYLVIGKIIYQLLDGNYIPVTSTDLRDQIIPERTYLEDFINITSSIYTLGIDDERYYSRPHMIYGLSALDWYLGDRDLDDKRVYESRNRDDWNDTRNNDAFYKNAMGDMKFWVETGGILIGYSKHFDAWKYEKRSYTKYFIDRETEHRIYGYGYMGALGRTTCVPADYTEARAYAKEDGTVEFKWAYNYREAGFSFGTYLTLQENISDIEHYYMNTKTNKFYVFTHDKDLIVYNMANRARTVLVEGYLERIADGVRIDEDTVMCDGHLFEGYREVYTNEYAGPSNTSIRYTLDTEGNYKALRKDYYGQREYLIAENVAELPYRRYGHYSTVADLTTTRYSDAYDRFVTEDGFLCESSEVHKLAYGSTPSADYPEPTKLSELKSQNTQFAGIYDRANHPQYGAYGSNYEFDAITSYEDGSLELAGVNYRYANLTVGDQADLVGDGELIGLSSESAVYPSLDLMMIGISDIYKDYSTSDNMLVLLGQEVNSEAVMLDYEEDPPYGPLTINSDHLDPYYYENSLGPDPSVGEGVAINQFNYVGHYKMTPRVRDNPVGNDDRFDDYRLWNADNTFVNVYVHRKPIANMRLYVKESDDAYALSLKDGGSYDLDHESLANKGIVDWEWSVKGDDETQWHKYHTKDLTLDDLEYDAYTIHLRVLDQEGVWSDQVTEHVDLSSVQLTLAASLKTEKSQFALDALPITEFISLYDIETVYPKPVSLEYGLYKEDGLVSDLMTLHSEADKNNASVGGEPESYGAYVDIEAGIYSWQNQRLGIGDQLPDGLYQLKVTAYDSSNPSIKDQCVFNVYVSTPINPEPDIEDLLIVGESKTMTCTSSIYTDELVVTLYEGTTYQEEIEMIFDQYIYEDINGREEAVKKLWTIDHEVAADIVEGNYKMAFTGLVHTEPNKSQTVIETVHVIALAFESVDITGAWNHWRGQVDLFGEQLDDMPYRFLSWEKIYFTAQTIGNPDEVWVDMSEALKAMSFTDKNGVTYHYEDDFGQEVDFPIQLTKQEDNLWIGEYILPLAPSTINWDDERQHASYQITVTAKKNAVERHYYFNADEGRGIDITGNTTDLIYVQPMSTLES